MVTSELERNRLADCQLDQRVKSNHVFYSHCYKLANHRLSFCQKLSPLFFDSFHNWAFYFHCHLHVFNQLVLCCHPPVCAWTIWNILGMIVGTKRNWLLSVVTDAITFSEQISDTLFFISIVNILFCIGEKNFQIFSVCLAVVLI